MNIDRFEVVSGSFLIHNHQRMLDGLNECYDVMAAGGDDMALHPDMEIVPVALNVLQAVVPRSDFTSFQGTHFTYEQPRINATPRDFVEPQNTEWQDRRDLLNELVHSLVFSASIIPANKADDQTLYVAFRSFPATDDRYWSLSDPQLLETNDPTRSHENPLFDLLEGNILGMPPNSQPESLALEGFVQPYAMSLRAVVAVHPFEGRRINVLSDSKDESSSTIESQDVKDKFSAIWDRFQTDTHTRELALTLADGANKRNYYFVKSRP